ncbi:hypothetical protein FM103_09665 [Corynebacterium xerosis]|nr:hypothetical protein FM103_09665 [Corynebacterium xerosis]
MQRAVRAVRLDCHGVDVQRECHAPRLRPMPPGRRPRVTTRDARSRSDHRAA